MDKNMDLTIGFKGQVSLNAQAVPLQEGYLKLGGIVSTSLTAGLVFGRVVSAPTNDMNVFKAGQTGTDVVRGIAVFDDSVAQNAPAHPDRYLAGMPCAAINHGFMWLGNWTKTATKVAGEGTAAAAIDPVIGCKVIYKKATGEIEFCAAADTPVSDWAVLDGASVRDVDPDNGALIYLN